MWWEDGTKPTEEQKQQVYKMIEDSRKKSFDEVEKSQIKDFVDMSILTKEDVAWFRTTHYVNKYLASILEVCVTIPNIIKTNQYVLSEIEDELSKFELEPTADDEKYTIWLSLMWHRRWTINHIKQKQEELVDRKTELENYKDIITQLSELI